MRLVTARVSEMSVQMAGFADRQKKTEQVFHCGASSKDAGKKLCAINRIENVEMVKSVVEKLMKGEDKGV